MGEGPTVAPEARGVETRQLVDPDRVRAYVNCCVELARVTDVTLPEMAVALESMLAAARRTLADKVRAASE